MTTLSILIPTPGQGRPLSRCLDSIKPQLHPGDEVLVIGDTHDGPLPEVEALVAEYGDLFRYIGHDAGHHCFGHCQLNHGLEQAKGDYLTANDDDDIYTPDAFAAMRAVAERLPEPRPLLFRFQSHYGPVWWDEQVVEINRIGGHCAVFPNLPGRVGRYTCRYQGDFDFIRSTLDLWPGGDLAAVWVNHIIAIARPSLEQDWTKQRAEAVPA
jgi:glycosyltransferase involved in cell wall biosynthesis